VREKERKGRKGRGEKGEEGGEWKLGEFASLDLGWGGAGAPLYVFFLPVYSVCNFVRR